MVDASPIRASRKSAVLGRPGSIHQTVLECRISPPRCFDQEVGEKRQVFQIEEIPVDVAIMIEGQNG